MPGPAATPLPRKRDYAPGHGTGTRALQSPDGDAWASSLVCPTGPVEPGRAAQAVGMLLLCQSRVERFIVGRCIWMGRPASETADAAGMVPQQVSQLLASLRHRLERVTGKARTDAELSRIADAGKGRRSGRRPESTPRVDLREPPELVERDGNLSGAG